jgi:hypothetical protein
MLVRIAAILGSVVAFTSCERAVESKLVGSWHWKGCDDAGDVVYRADHTFSSREWAVTYTHQPPVVIDDGEWHIRGSRLVLDFKGDTRPIDGKHLELPFTLFDKDTLLVRTADGRMSTFERLK